MPAELVHVILIAIFFFVIAPVVCLVSAKTKGVVRIIVVAISMILTAVAAFRWGHFVGYDHSAMATHENFVEPFSRYCEHSGELLKQGEIQKVRFVSPGQLYDEMNKARQMGTSNRKM